MIRKTEIPEIHPSRGADRQSKGILHYIQHMDSDKSLVKTSFNW